MCRQQSLEKLDTFKGRITLIPGATNDREVIKRAVAGCDGVLVVLVPRGVHGYSTGTAQAVLDHAPAAARLVCSCGWHITRDGQDVYRWKLSDRETALVCSLVCPPRRSRRPVVACRRVFGSDAREPSCVAAITRRAIARACPSGADMLSDPILRATSRAAWTSHYSWWRRRRTRAQPRSPMRPSATRRPPRSRTPLRNRAFRAPRTSFVGPHHATSAKLASTFYQS